VLLSIFEVVPVLGALLFRTGLTGFASRTPLIIAFVLTFVADFMRQKIPAFERRVSELHVKAIMDGDVKQLSPCWQRFRDFVSGIGDDDMIMSAPQLAAMMALTLALLLPYVVGVSHDKLRSSLLSCWLGIACVLAVQLDIALRANGAVKSEYTGSNQKLSPKHRE